MVPPTLKGNPLRKTRQMSFDVLESRVVLSPTNPLDGPAIAVDPPTTVIDNPDEMMRRLMEEATQDAAISNLREMWERDRSIAPTMGDIPEFPPPTFQTPDQESHWYDAVWEAIRQGLDTGFQGSPQIHP
jgi:hypothetical protein